jgi:hypothetical protein
MSAYQIIISANSPPTNKKYAAFDGTPKKANSPLEETITNSSFGIERTINLSTHSVPIPPL